jgi:DNA-binding response OmpR family regulator
MRIGILDNDQSQAHFICHALTHAGHVCHAYSEGHKMVHQLRRESFDLLVIDWDAPDMPGDQVLRWVRTNMQGTVPVLFTTNRSYESDTVAMLNAGADDYIVKPASATVLTAHVAALLRRAYGALPEEGSRRQFGDYLFDPAMKSVSFRGDSVYLTTKEFELALMLFRNLGRPLSRTHIIELVWKREMSTFSRTVDTHISMIRIKLQLRPQNGYRLSALYTHGYQLERVDPAAQEPAAAEPSIARSVE